MNLTLRQIISLIYLPWIMFKENVLGMYGVRILMFHSVAKVHVEGIDNKNVVEIKPAEFRRIINYLAPRYRFISLEELAEMIRQKIPLPKRTLVLTFDDGYANNYKEVLPALKKFNLRATVFMPSGFIGKPGYLDREMIGELLAEHIELGGHTVSHPTLAKIDDKKAWQEISRCKEELELVTGKPVNTFSYPKGKISDYTSQTVEMVTQAGFHAACSTMRGTNTLKTSVFELNRVGIDGRDSFFNFWLKLKGGYDWTGTISRWKAKRQK